MVKTSECVLMGIPYLSNLSVSLSNACDDNITSFACCMSLSLIVIAMGAFASSASAVKTFELYKSISLGLLSHGRTYLIFFGFKATTTSQLSCLMGDCVALCRDRFNKRMKGNILGGGFLVG